MTVAFAAGVAVLGIAGAIGHSLISERRFLRPLYAEPRTGLFAARVEGGNPLLSIVAAIIFTASGVGNVVALRRLHFSGLLMLGAAALTLADLML